jgi:hypothetical protein
VRDRDEALAKALENGDRYPIGVFLEIWKADLASGLPLPSKTALVEHETDLKVLQKIIDKMAM